MKQVVPKGYLQYDSIHITLLKWQDFRNGLVEVREGRWYGYSYKKAIAGVFVGLDLFCLYQWVDAQTSKKGQNCVELKIHVKLEKLYKSVRIGCESTIALVKIRSTWKTQSYRATRILIHCWWKCKTIQLLWITKNVPNKNAYVCSPKNKFRAALVIKANNDYQW